MGFMYLIHKFKEMYEMKSNQRNFKIFFFQHEFEEIRWTFIKIESKNSHKMEHGNYETEHENLVPFSHFSNIFALCAFIYAIYIMPNNTNVSIQNVIFFCVWLLLAFLFHKFLHIRLLQTDSPYHWQTHNKTETEKSHYDKNNFDKI